MSDLDELKTLLFGAEKEVLDSIQQRVQMPEARAADIAAVLPEAIRLRHRENDDLVDSLKDPFGHCLRESLRETPEEFSDALYPVMGPAIRKSIAHALKAFAERINQTLEHSLSVKGIKWRIEAARAGVPFPSYIIQQSLLYRVEQAYLISRENGLLVSHVHHDASHIKDSDAVSAMFTAIQDFVKESFSPDRSGRLETADMGEFTLWAVHGPHALLVCVIRGVPPRELRTELSRVLERLHFRFGEALREYHGDTSSVTGIEDELSVCLEMEAARKPESAKKGRPWALIVIALLALGLMGYGAWTAWQQAQQFQRLEAVLAETPGVYVGNIERTDSGYSLVGLRDPLAADLAAIAERAGLDATALTGQLRPYRSLDDAIQLQRAMQQLAPEVGTSIELVDGKLLVSGVARHGWIANAQAKAATVDLGWPVDFSGVTVAEWPMLQARADELNDAQFFFANGSELAAESVQRLSDYGSRLKQLADDVAGLGGTLEIVVTGHTDASGSPARNAILARQRADAVVAALLPAGLLPARIQTLAAVPQAADGTADASARRATVALQLNPALR